jgi:methyl-accepting chemotaxis protein
MLCEDGAMTARFLSKSIVWQLILPAPIMLGLGMFALWTFMPSLLADNARESAIRNATQTVNQFKMMRGYYTQNVVKKVLENGGAVSINHKSESDSIPLPATLIHDMGELLSKEDTTLQLYSRFPFPNRSERSLDAFQESAWDFLSDNPDEVYSHQETRDGKEVIRVAVADRMVAEACVSCHNSRLDTPKNDWALGDVRGVLEVATIIDGELAAGAGVSNRILLISGFGLVALMLLCVLIGRRVTKPIMQMTATMRKLADGDHDVEVTGADRGDELGAMARAVEVFKQNAIEREELQSEQADRHVAREQQAERMGVLISQFDGSIGDVVETVASASVELQATAKALADTAEQTNQQSMAVASATVQATGNVQTVAAASEELSSSIGEIGRQVNQSTKIAGKAVDEAARTNQTIQGLEEAARKIGDVVTLISDIAQQTNLLALNATIEAARAGEAGKGFAVVASEVKSLATQTAKATEDIAAQIASMQAVTGDAVGAIGGIGATIGEISEITAAIAAAVEEQGAATQEISRNVQQAAQGTGDISANIEQVTEAATGTGAASKQVLEAVGKLSCGAEDLRAGVDRFLVEIKAA